jgi:hypothetical protein
VPSLGAIIEVVDRPRLSHDVTGSEPGVDRGEWILVDQLHVPANLAQRGPGEGEQILPEECRRTRIRFDEA